MPPFDVILHDRDECDGQIDEYLAGIDSEHRSDDPAAQGGIAVASGLGRERADEVAGAIEDRGGEASVRPTTMADGAGTTGETRPADSEEETPAEEPTGDEETATDETSGTEDGESATPTSADDESATEEPADLGADAVGDDVFRFMTVRPAEVESTSVVTVSGVESQFIDALATEPPDASRERAEEYADSGSYVTDLTGLSLPLATLDGHLSDGDTMTDVADAVETVLGRPPDEVVGSDGFEDDRRRLAESLATSTVRTGADTDAHSVQTRGLRLLDMIERAATGAAGTVGEARQRAVSLPDGIRRPRRDGSDGDEEESSGPPQRVVDLADRLGQVRDAIREVSTVDLPAAASTGGAGETEFDAETVQPDAGGGGGFLSGLFSFGSSTPGTTDGPALPRGTVPPEAQPDAGALAGGAAAWTLTDDTLGSLSSTTRSVLSDAGLDTGSTQTLPRVSTSLERRETEVGTSLYAELFGGGASASVALGSGMYPTSGTLLGDSLLDTLGTAGLGMFDGVDPGGLLSPEDLPDLGAVRPLGVAEMRSVRKKLKRYELGEVAHVENVLEGESKERRHLTETTSEETFITETETEAEQKDDLKTAERFEMERETEQSIEEKTSTEAGVQVTASYGPTVEVQANASYSSSSVREEAEKAARSYSREITERSVERMKKREFERTEQFDRRHVEEENVHGFENDDDGNVTGVYRYVDKVYEARVMQSPEKRMLVEFIVPEPAAFYRQAQAQNPAENVRVEKPREPVYAEGLDQVDDGDEFASFYENLGDNVRPLQPTDLTRSNYKYYAAQYGADVDPPPAKYDYVTETFSEQPEGTDPSYKNTTVEVDDERVATKANVAVAELHSRSPGKQADTASVKVYVADGLVHGYTRYSYRRPYTGSIDLEDLTGEVPVLVSASQVHGWAASVSLLCERTDAAFEQWQLDTYQAIMNAYEEDRAKYEDALKAASTGDGVDIQGRNPETNRDIERAELKKHAIGMLRDEHVDIDAVESDGRVDLDAADEVDDMISFFEQAFEWSAMTYLFYPYYWSRREKWPALLGIEDTDPLFANFLKAGAARVVVPVRTGMTQDVLWYLQHGELWHGDDAPDVTDSRFVPIAQEMREQQSGPTGYTADGDPWEVTVPTELVALQDGPELPEFAPIEWPEGS